MSDTVQIESPETLAEYRRTSFGWKMSRCPDWCNQRHLTEAIWFERSSFHQSDTITVHLPAAPDTALTLETYGEDVEMYIDAAGPGMKSKWGPSINIHNPGNVDGEGHTALNADQAEEIALGLLALVRQLRQS